MPKTLIEVVKATANLRIKHAQAFADLVHAERERARAEALDGLVTLEDLEAQVARTQGRSTPTGLPLAHQLDKLTEEAREVREAWEDLETAIQEARASVAGPYDEVSPEHLERIEDARNALALELGDVLNVAIAMVMHSGLTLRQVMHGNDEKLRARWPGGLGVDVTQEG